jgi:hypothetical protein
MVTEGRPSQRVENEAPPAQSVQALKAELGFLSEVYTALRSEIRNDENKITANTNYALAGIGVVVALTSLIASSQQYVLFLALPFVFYALMLMNYGHHLGIARIASYLTVVVYPRMRAIIRELDGGSHDFGEFTVDWDMYRHQSRVMEVVTLPIGASTYGLHILASLLPIVLFLYFKQVSGTILSAFEMGFLIADGVGLLGIALYVVILRSATRHWRRAR